MPFTERDFEAGSFFLTRDSYKYYYNDFGTSLLCNDCVNLDL